MVEKVLISVGVSIFRLISLPLVIVGGMIASIFTTLRFNYSLWKKDMDTIWRW